VVVGVTGQKGGGREAGRRARQARRGRERRCLLNQRWPGAAMAVPGRGPGAQVYPTPQAA
jgi:hypothetical protein